MKRLASFAALAAIGVRAALSGAAEPLNVSGIYPSLAYYNDEGECGTGAVVPWAGSLWIITAGLRAVHVSVI